MGFPGGSVVKNLPLSWRPRFNSWAEKIPWRRAWQPTPVFLTGESHRQRSLFGYSPLGRKETDTTEWLTHTQDSVQVFELHSSTMIQWLKWTRANKLPHYTSNKNYSCISIQYEVITCFSNLAFRNLLIIKTKELQRSRWNYKIASIN